MSVDQVPEGAYLLDVGEPDEWAAGRAPQAHHVPMYEIPDRLEDVPADGDVVVVCRVGGRSAQVVNFLRAQGRENVLNLAGGMQAWATRGLPMVTDKDAPPQVI